jgi:hypothetical protein
VKYYLVLADYFYINTPLVSLLENNGVYFNIENLKRFPLPLVKKGNNLNLDDSGIG